MTYRAPTPRHTGPVNDMDAGAFFTGVAFIAAGVVAWPALVLVYQIIVVFVGGGVVPPVLPSVASVLQLAAFALFTGLVSGLIRLKLRNTSRYLADLVEAILGAASAGQITFAAILLNLATGFAIGMALSLVGVSSPFDVLAGSEAFFMAGGAIALAMSGGGGPPPEWYDTLLMLFFLLSALGAIIGTLVAALFAWIGNSLGATAGPSGSRAAAALVVALTRLFRMERNPIWQPETPLPRELGELMSELAIYEKQVWRREPRRDLLENYRAWLVARGHAFTPTVFIEYLPEHRDWLRTHGTTQGQRYLGAFADWMTGILVERRREIEWRERRGPVSKLSYTDKAPAVLEPGEPLTYPGWISSALKTGLVAGLGIAVLLFIVLSILLIRSWV
jgi:hypothetical protein